MLRNETHETDIIQDHLRRRESTMEAIASASAGMSILRLNNAFGEDITDENIDSLFKQAINTLKSQATPEQLAAISYFVERANENYNRLDRVTLYLPDDKKAGEYKSEEYLFPLKQVFILVWRALHDASEYKEQEKQVILDRTHSLVAMLAELKANPICHHGIRHELLSTINKIHPLVDFIVSADAFVLSYQRNLLRDALENHLPETGNTDKTLQDHLLIWLKTENAKQLFDTLNITQTAEKGLEEILIDHGSNPNEKHVKQRITSRKVPFTDAIDTTEDKVLSSLHSILSSPNGLTDATTEQAKSRIIEWLKSDFSINSPEDRDLCKQHAVVLSATQSLQQYSTLLATSEQAATVTIRQKTCKQYFKAYLDGKTPRLDDSERQNLINTQQIINNAKHDKQYTFIENFFCLWHEARNQKNCTELYKRIINKKIRDKITLSKHEVETYLKANDEGVVDVSPYDINRIFLHAILTRTHNWEPEFAILFETTLNFVKANFNQQGENPAKLRIDSYGFLLLWQLEYLQAHYQQVEPAPEKPYWYILNPLAIQNMDQWELFCRYVNDNQLIESIFTIIRASLIKACRKSEDKKDLIGDIAETIPTDSQFSFLTQAFGIELTKWVAIEFIMNDLILAILSSEACDNAFLIKRDEDNNTALINAADCDNINLVNAILASKHCNEDVLSARGEDGATALMHALDHGHTEIASTILASEHCTEKTLNIVDDEQWHAVSLAAFYGQTDIFNTIIASDNFAPDLINAKYNNGATVLIHAAEHGDTDIAHAILANKHFHREAFNATQNDGSNALMRAASKGNTEIVNMILEHEHCNKDTLNATRNYYNFNALMLAAKMGHIECVRAILASKHCTHETLNTIDVEGNSAIMWAIRTKQADIVEEIITHKHFKEETFNNKSKDDHTALTLATFHNNINGVHAILTSKHCTEKTLNTTLTLGRNALMYAAHHGKTSIVSAILASKHCTQKTFNAQDHKGHNALMHATINGESETACTMLSSKHCNADTLNATNELGETLLMLAAKHGHVEIVNRILKHEHFNKDTLNEKDVNGMTALMLAQAYKHTEVVRAIRRVTIKGIVTKTLRGSLEETNNSKPYTSIGTFAKMFPPNSNTGMRQKNQGATLKRRPLLRKFSRRAGK